MWFILVSRLIGTPNFDLDEDGNSDIGVIIMSHYARLCYVRKGFKNYLKIFGNFDNKYCSKE